MLRNRAEWFEQRLRQSGESVNRFAVRSGADIKSVRQILAGADVHDDVLAMVAAALDCLPTDIPSS